MLAPHLFCQSVNDLDSIASTASLDGKPSLPPCYPLWQPAHEHLLHRILALIAMKRRWQRLHDSCQQHCIQSLPELGGAVCCDSVLALTRREPPHSAHSADAHSADAHSADVPVTQRPLADSAQEAYIHPLSKSRYNSQRSGHRKQATDGAHLHSCLTVLGWVPSLLLSHHANVARHDCICLPPRLSLTLGVAT